MSRRLCRVHLYSSLLGDEGETSRPPLSVHHPTLGKGLAGHTSECVTSSTEVFLSRTAESGHHRTSHRSDSNLSLSRVVHLFAPGDSLTPFQPRPWTVVEDLFRPLYRKLTLV